MRSATKGIVEGRAEINRRMAQETSYLRGLGRIDAAATTWIVRPRLTSAQVEGLSPPLELTLDSAVEYISQEELVEVTPVSIRMAKARGWNDKKKK